MSWKSVPATIIAGHGVASGQKGDPRFPGGTLAMQMPFFAELGLDLSPFHRGTLNLSIAPWEYQVLGAKHTYRQVKWSPTEPAEDFSFLECRLQASETAEPVEGLVYYPHPETKPEHFQPPDVLEVLAPWMEGVHYGDKLQLAARTDQLRFELRQTD